MTIDPGTVEVFGSVGILNVGAGDTKLSFDPSNPADRIRAARIVKDMIRRGYALLVEVERDGVKSFERATDFREDTCEYVIADFDPLVAAEHDAAEEKKETSDEVEQERRRAEKVAEKRARSAAAAERRLERSRLREQEQSRSLDRREAEAKMALVESFDGFAALRSGLGRIAGDRGEWAGIPMPLDGHRLVVEPTYPKAKELSAIGAPDVDSDDLDRTKIRNRWWSNRRRGDIVIFEENGRIDWGVFRSSRLDHDLMTLGCSDVWGIRQESAAVDLLGTLVSHRQFKQYLLTGMFLETSKRSGVTYLFRRLKPTVAIRSRGESTRILAALCLHPIAYYAGSWAGAMTPTDDVVAHLMLMRGDEVMFWRRSNQHAPWRPEAGL